MAGGEIECDHAGAGASADGKDEEVAIDQGRGIERAGRELIFGDKIALPKNGASARIEAFEDGEHRKPVNASVLDDRRAPGPRN